MDDDVLRRPVGPPALPEPFVVPVGWDAGAAARLRWGTLRALVLHGPPGVGKSARAAALAKSLTTTTPPHAATQWVSVGRSADPATVVLRLLARCGAPRREIAPLARMDEDEFMAALREQCALYVGPRVVVLDDVDPALGQALVPLLKPSSGLLIFTSREEHGWEGSGAVLHPVRPLRKQEAAQLTRAVGRSYDQTGAAHIPLRDLMRVTGGLPPLLRIAGTLPTEPASFWWRLQGPEDLVAHTVDQLDPVQQDLLRRLAVRHDTRPFSPRMAEALLRRTVPAPQAADALSPLLFTGLARELCEGQSYEIPAPVADAVRRGIPEQVRQALAEQVGDDLWEAVYKSVEDTVALLDGNAPQGWSGPGLSQLTPEELAASADELSDLIPGKRQKYPASQARHRLQVLLAARGDVHRLLGCRRSEGGGDAFRLAEALSDVGMPETALRLLPASSVHDHQSARVWHARGNLEQALRSLGDEPPALHDDAAWLLATRGAVLCDQGRPREAAEMLLKAADLHRGADCRRGRGWALLHHARARLLLGETTEAGHTLTQALSLLRGVSDLRGVNWVATEQTRLQLLLGRTDEAFVTASNALTAHERAEDIRGMGWTCHHLGLVHAEMGDREQARVALQAGLRHFEECGDELGAAWTGHRLALLDPDDSPAVVEKLTSASARFQDLGCLHGVAWSLLERALRRDDRASANALLAKAWGAFADLSDCTGLLWTQMIKQHRGLGPALTVESFTGALSTGSSAAQQLRNDTQELWPASVDAGRPAIPLHARDIIAAPATQGQRMSLDRFLQRPAPPSPGGPRCTVHVALLDDSPTARSTARLLVRVVPEADHPWSAPTTEPPWLTAVATPLGHASMEPATALLRPSAEPARGAEFGFTPHRPGLHRIRFTIALERTGTVLQQVETELDILDTDRPGGHAAPQVAVQRRR